MRYKRTILARLNDRGVLKGDDSYRKQVYMTERDGQRCVLVKIINPSYRAIFNRNIQALIVCDNYNINAPRLIDFDSVGMELLMTDVGENIFDVENKKLKKGAWLKDGLVELKKINDIKKRLGRLQRLPYFQKLKGIANPSVLESKICDYYQQTIQSTGDVYLGYGIDDPSPTNFCSNNKTVFIIDFDNFFCDTNIWISYGFAISNLYTKKEKTDVTFKDAVTLLYSFGICSIMTTVEKQLFRIGLLNNLATLHYDDFIEDTKFSGQWESFELSILDTSS